MLVPVTTICSTGGAAMTFCSAEAFCALATFAANETPGSKPSSPHKLKLSRKIAHGFRPRFYCLIVVLGYSPPSVPHFELSFCMLNYSRTICNKGRSGWSWGKGGAANQRIGGVNHRLTAGKVGVERGTANQQIQMNQARTEDVLSIFPARYCLTPGTAARSAMP